MTGVSKGTAARGRVFPALVLALLVMAITPAIAHASGPPTIEATSVSAVRETSAILKATVDPNGSKTPVYHFQYVDQQTFEKSGFAEAESTPDGPPLSPGAAATPFAATVEGLAPDTAYRFRAVAENLSHERAEGPDLGFRTLAPAQAFGPCPDDAFRSGEFAAPGHPSSLLPDCRAYEQASPVAKNGNDILGIQPLAKAAEDGGAVSFGSTFGLPGGEGAQELPLYAASRGEGEAGWQTSGLLPPATAGEEAQLMGWLPDFAAAYARARRIASPPSEALFELRPGAPARQITPYVPPTNLGTNTFTYAGAPADDSAAVLDATVRLPEEEEGGALLPGSREGRPNVYAYEREGRRTHLVSQLNTEAETDAALPKGAVAGPYAWAQGVTKSGGAAGARDYYVQQSRAIAADGSTFFTATGSGQLYRRLHPTMTQSNPGPGGYVEDGHCAEAAKACTLHVSATEKDNSPVSPDGTDPAGPQPAAFQAASADGSVAFFTSSEKLTNDANTGPEQALAAIGRLKAEDDQPPAENTPALLSAHALGLAVSPDGRYAYWANPADGTIGRADLETEAVEADFISPEPTECEVNVAKEGGGYEKVPATAPTAPRYVAVDAGHVYWTNTGPLEQFGEPENGCGTIGRATIDPLTGEVEGEPDPEWITGASNPEGVAVDSSHVYWANAAAEIGTASIGRASIGGGGVDQSFFDAGNERPRGVALDANYLYFSTDEIGSSSSYVNRITFEGEPDGRLVLRENGRSVGVRGIALSGGDIYWAQENEEAIGRAPLSDLKPGVCPAFPDCENEYLPMDGKPFGLAAGPEGHLYYSVNGEAHGNPGADLYRWSAAPDAQGHHLEDITADPTGDGAEVQGVVGASADGARLYFVANGDLDGAGPATAGDCRETIPGVIASTQGECSLYLWHRDPGSGESTTSFVARLQASGLGSASDAHDWTPSPFVFQDNTSVPKTGALSEDGRTLLFASQRQLTSYPNEGVSELYRYREGGPLTCISCNPSGAAPTEAPQLGTRMGLPGLSFSLGAAAVATRFLSSDGERAFFETEEALVGADRDSNNDVYEWEAPGKGSCEEASPAFVAGNGGCLYLLSPGEDSTESLFVDASTSGDDAFILTRAPLVGQDQDQLFDAYDARVGGGLAAQTPPPPEGCEGEACKGPGAQAPPPPAPTTAGFQGPGNPPAHKRCPKAKRAVRRHGHTTCAPKHPKHRHHRKHHHNRRTHR
jgi:hypothetical protein